MTFFRGNDGGGGAEVTKSVQSAPRSDGAGAGAFRFVHVAAIVHVAVAVLSLQSEAEKVGWFAELATTLIWAETAAALALLAVLNRRRRLSRFAAAGAVQTISAPRYELSRGMGAALSDGGGDIRLSELTGFEWDVVEIYAVPSDGNLTPTGRGG